MKRIAAVLCTFCLAAVAGACADDPEGTICTATWTIDASGGTGEGGVNSVDFDYPDINSVDEAVTQCKADAASHADAPEPGPGETLTTNCECSTA